MAYNPDNKPSADKIRNSRAIPWASQIPNDSSLAGDYISDAVEGVNTATSAVSARVDAIGSGRSIVENSQTTAATATLRAFRATSDGVILKANAETGVVAASGESMTFDVQIGGVTCLTGVITIDDGVSINVPEAGTIDTGANTFSAGDLITVVRTYVAGGSATPMANTVCGIEIQLDE